MAAVFVQGRPSNPLAIPEVLENVIDVVSEEKGRGLASCARVCRAWSDIALSLIWSYVTFDTFAELLTGDTLAKFVVKEDGRIVSDPNSVIHSLLNATC